MTFEAAFSLTQVKKINVCLCFINIQQWLINEQKVPVNGMKLPTGFQLIGQVVRNTYLVLFHIVCKSTHVLLRLCSR